MIKVQHNFLDYINNIHEHIKSLEYFDCEEYYQHMEGPHTWPGKRTLCFSKVYPMLYLHIRSAIKRILVPDIDSYSDIIILSAVKNAEDQKSDWIHKDFGETILIYTGKTDLNSGTDFFAEKSDEPILSCKYVKNTALYFNGDIRHQGVNCYGTNMEDSRYTINCFLHKTL